MESSNRYWHIQEFWLTLQAMIKIKVNTTPPHKYLVFLILIFNGCFPPLHAGLYQQLEAVVDQKMAETGVPGLLMGVWRGNTEIAVFEKGFSNIHTQEAISRLDSLRIASVTKSFTVTRILQLHDAGLLSLDDPISAYIPGLQNEHATLRQLANMTSGIFNYTEDPDLVMELLTNPTRVWTDAELIGVANAPENSPYFAPGEGWHYSNTNIL